MLVGVNDGLATAGCDLHRNDLVLEPAGLLRRFGLGLRRGGEGVLLVARDLPALGDVLGGVAHVIAVEGIPQPVAYHRVDELGIAHLDAVAQVDAVRRLAHALLSAGDDDLRIAVADRLIAEGHGAQARAAELVDPIGCHLVGDAGGDCGLAGRVLALTGSEDLAHDYLGNLFRPDLGATQRLDDCDLAELVRRQAAEPAVEGPNRGARSARNHDIGHQGSPRWIYAYKKKCRECRGGIARSPASLLFIARPIGLAISSRWPSTAHRVRAADIMPPWFRNRGLRTW